jgi:hypothetical protein
MALVHMVAFDEMRIALSFSILLSGGTPPAPIEVQIPKSAALPIKVVRIIHSVETFLKLTFVRYTRLLQPPLKKILIWGLTMRNQIQLQSLRGRAELRLRRISRRSAMQISKRRRRRLRLG